MDKVYSVSVHLASHEYQWGRRLPDGTWEDADNIMKAAAQEVFDAHPDKPHMVVTCYEHAGWWLDFYKDGSVIGSANDRALFGPDKLRLIDRLHEMETVHLPSIRRPEYDLV